MVAIVVPFRGTGGKQRLDAPEELRDRLALAMLADVLTACVATGPTRVVTSDAAAIELAEELGAEVVADPGGGQGAAVAAGLSGLPDGPTLVVNADVPCVVPHDLRTLATRSRGRRLRPRRGGGRDDERPRPSVAVGVRAALRRRAARVASASTPPRSGWSRPAPSSRTSATTSTRWPTSSGSRTAPRRAHRPRSAR